MNHLIDNITNIHQLINIDGNFNGMPFMLFIKDKNGKYLHANRLKLGYFGFKEENNICGLTDFDLCMSHQQAMNLRQNDTRILKTEQNLHFIETATVSNGETLTGISYKSPFRLRTKKIIGLLGVSFIIPEHKSKQRNLIYKRCIPSLSKRQNECLNLLSNGMTIKEIARIMTLSPRTVEHYLEAVKTKLQCNTRSDLVTYYLNFTENQL